MRQELWASLSYLLDSLNVLGAHWGEKQQELLCKKIGCVILCNVIINWRHIITSGICSHQCYIRKEYGDLQHFRIQFTFKSLCDVCFIVRHRLSWRGYDSNVAMWEMDTEASSAHIHTKQCKEVGVSTGKRGIPVEWFWYFIQTQGMRMTRWVCINALLDCTEQINHCLLFCRKTEFEKPRKWHRENTNMFRFSLSVLYYIMLDII